MESGRGRPPHGSSTDLSHIGRHNAPAMMTRAAKVAPMPSASVVPCGDRQDCHGDRVRTAISKSTSSNFLASSFRTRVVQLHERHPRIARLLMHRGKLHALCARIEAAVSNFKDALTTFAEVGIPPEYQWAREARGSTKTFKTLRGRKYDDAGFPFYCYLEITRNPLRRARAASSAIGRSSGSNGDPAVASPISPTTGSASGISSRPR